MISSLILVAALTGGCQGGQCTVVRPVQAVVRVAVLPARAVVHLRQVVRERVAYRRGWLQKRRCR